MSDFKSALHMAEKLIMRGLKPTTVQSMVKYSYGVAPDINRINKLYDEFNNKNEKKRIKQEKQDAKHVPNNNEDVKRAAMEMANARFVKALWSELHMIQRRKRANG